MIGYLRGRIVDRGEETLTVDVGGVGYLLQCSSLTLDEVFDRDDVEMWVETHVREAAISLFGFATRTEKETFLSLIKVNGVGPKMAIKILSGSSLDRLAAMIEAGDVKGLANLPKVGKKTAEQLILSLRGKLVLSPLSQPGLKASRTGTHAAEFSGREGELYSGLINLGYRPQDVEKVVRELPVEVDLQSGLRLGLQALSGQI